MNSTAGFNIIGPINSLSPAGDSARTILAQLSALHFPFSYLDLRLEGEGTLPNIFSPESQWGILKEMPYSINIFLIDPEKILSLMSGHPSCINTHERTNVCLVGSGIQQIPESWIHILQKMDVVLVSNFELKTKVETFAKRTVALVHRNFYLNENGKHELDSLLANDDDPIASRTPVFLCELDAKAVSETQDPTWVLRAFKMAFPDGIGASLSIHLRGESFPTQPTPLGDLLRELARKFPSIRVLEKEDSKIATDSFLSTCDVYVALLPEKGEVNGVLHAMHGGKAVLTNRNFISGHQIHEDQAALIRTLEQGLPDLEQAADWMKRLAANPKLCQSMGRKIKDKLNVNVRPTEQQGVFQEIARIHGMRARKKNATGRPRILFQNRSSAYLNPGGDTVVMNKLQAELEVLGARVDFSPANTVDLVDYDLVHLFNATLPQVTEAFAQNAVRQRKPYVFHAFQEMFSKYTAQCVLFRRILETYIFKGQPIGMLDELMKLSSTSTIERDVTSPYAMSHASVVFACSEREAQSIQSLNPSAKVQVSTYGATVVPSKIGPELFEQQFGVRNFILCVGRLEGRKNQLMLLAALENSDSR